MPDLWFQERWFDDTTANALKYYVELTQGIKGEYIEIGCWEGLSSVTYANLIYPDTLVCIDTFEGTPYETYEVDQYSKRNVEDTFRHNIEEGTKGNVEVNKMTWESYFDSHNPAIKLLYLDGPHGYDDVCNQINIIKDFVVSGGIILGDDYHYFSSVKNAVHDTLGDKAKVSHLDIDTWVWVNDQ